MARKRSKFSQVAWIAGPTLAAAAGILLLVRGTGTMGAPGEAPEVAAIRFKGNTEASVIRERGGTQLRFTEEVAVRGNDRLRVEISVTAPQVLTAGLLEEKGVWNVLLAPKTLAVGAHPSEFAARIDAHGATGWILVGEPALVEHARTTRDFSSVRAIRVTTEPPPVEEEGRRPSSERSRGERDGAVFGGGNRAPR